MFRRVKKYIKAVEMRSAMRIEIPEKGILEIFFHSTFEHRGSKYLVIKSTRYEVNDHNLKIIGNYDKVPIIDKREFKYEA